MDVRRPATIEQALQDCIDAIAARERIAVVPTHELLVDMLSILVKLKHS